MTDHAQIDALIDEFFRSFDNRDGRLPASASLCGLFVATAIISRHNADACEFFDTRGFVEPRIRLLTDGSVTGFGEWETDSTTDIRGPIATRVSRYEKTGSLHGTDCSGKGTKVFQLARGTSGWRIVALSWFDHSFPGCHEESRSSRPGAVAASHHA